MKVPGQFFSISFPRVRIPHWLHVAEMIVLSRMESSYLAGFTHPENLCLSFILGKRGKGELAPYMKVAFPRLGKKFAMLTDSGILCEDVLTLWLFLLIMNVVIFVHKNMRGMQCTFDHVVTVFCTPKNLKCGWTVYFTVS